MNPTDALAWWVGGSAALGMLASLRFFTVAAPGWVLLQGASLVLAFLGATRSTDALTYVASTIWFGCVLGPALLLRRQRELALRYCFIEAARWGRIAGWLHPFDGVPEQATYFRAQAAASVGHFERARALFVVLARSRIYGDLAQAELWRLDGQWQRIVDFVERERAAVWPRTLASAYLRALGETGCVSRMLSAYGTLPRVIRDLPQLRVVVLALAGRPDLLRQLFAGSLASFGGRGQSYWLAVAEQSAGELDSARTLLARLNDGGPLAAQAAQRLEAPLELVTASSLSPEGQSVLAALAREIAEERTLNAAMGAPGPPVATLCAGLVLTLVFVVGNLAAGEDIVGLIERGALVLPVQLTSGGAWWRVVSAGFLHFNATHLVMNLLGLWVLGLDAERAWGRRAMLACLLGASIGAYAIALCFMDATVAEPKVLMGASAGVLALVGGLGAFSAVGYLMRGNRLQRRRLGSMASIVLLQLVFDAFTPMASSFLHLAGTVCGALLAIPFSLRYFARLPALGRS